MDKILAIYTSNEEVISTIKLLLKKENPTEHAKRLSQTFHKRKQLFKKPINIWKAIQLPIVTYKSLEWLKWNTK